MKTEEEIKSHIKYFDDLLKDEDLDKNSRDLFLAWCSALKWVLKRGEIMNTEEKIKFLAEFLLDHYEGGQVHPAQVGILKKIAKGVE